MAARRHRHFLTTIGGCAAMNVHGKNAYQVGAIGEHILEFDMMLPAGEIITCSPTDNSDIFYAAIGGAGLLGCFTSLTLQMKRIYSGNLRVHTQAQVDLAGMFAYFAENVADSSYIVGWMDAFGSGSSLGRGDVHRADYLKPGEDPTPQPEYAPGESVSARELVWRRAQVDYVVGDAAVYEQCGDALRQPGKILCRPCHRWRNLFAVPRRLPFSAGLCAQLEEILRRRGLNSIPALHPQRKCAKRLCRHFARMPILRAAQLPDGIQTPPA
ncbi:MAG: hypothetical protein M5U34_26060 [Chloroflexi bacterium]|nr:hypothetical protein [Chloroflexota bacterium]